MVAIQLKKPVNLSLSEAVLKEARDMKINMSKAAEDGIVKALAHEKAERWKKENAAALEGWNDYFDKNGLPLAPYRQF